MDIESGFSLRLSRLLQIGINGNYLLLRLPLRVERFPDYFKSELMETLYVMVERGRFELPLSRLLQIGINGNFKSQLKWG